jgi:predicted nucleic acid-binding protein
MKVVIDSNVLLVAIGKRSKYRPIWSAFIDGKYKLIISEDILHEYEEILKAYSAPGAAEIVLEPLSSLLILSSNVSIILGVQSQWILMTTSFLILLSRPMPITW